MTYHLVVVIGLFTFALNMIFNLRVIKKPNADNATLYKSPFVSVLIPARDEEDNIEACVKSLQLQDYPNYEILVLDDNSSDSTSSIVQRMSSDSERTQLLHGEELPKGWAGKPFACYQLAKKAKGSWLLFVDADTIHTEDMLSCVMTSALKTGCSLLSGFPRQIAKTLPEKAAMPLIYFIILSWLPLWWLQRSAKPKPQIAIGQFLLFPKDDYWSFGGHEAVKSRILDDIWLGIEVHRQGGRHVVINLSSVVSCRMYRNIGGIWHGLVKCIYSVAAMSSLALAGLILVATIFFFLPFYSLWCEFFVLTAPSVGRSLIVSQVTIILSMRWMTDKQFREPAVSAILHPIGISFLIMAVFYSVLRQAMGRHVQWKKRLYGGKSGLT